MGFFAELSAWLNALLANYISTNTARVAQVLEPAFVTLGVLYVMGWGFLQLTGQIEEPLLAGLKRIAILALIFGVGLHLWLYNAFLVDTFFNAPSQLAAVIVGANDSVGIVDAIIFAGDDTATLLLQKAGIRSVTSSYYLAGFAVSVLAPRRCDGDLHDLSSLPLSDRALGSLGVRAALHRSPVFRKHQALRGSLVRPALELRLRRDPHGAGCRLDADTALNRCTAGSGRGRQHSDCASGACVSRGGPDVSHDAPGDADGGRPCKWPCTLNVRGRERGARAFGGVSGSLHPRGAHGSGDLALGFLKSEGRLLPAA